MVLVTVVALMVAAAAGDSEADAADPVATGVAAAGGVAATAAVAIACLLPDAFCLPPIASCLLLDCCELPPTACCLLLPAC